MAVTILLFAGIAERAGTRRLQLEFLAGDTVRSVRDRLADRIPGIATFFPSLMYARNEEYVALEEAIGDGDTLALIPPVSGG